MSLLDRFGWHRLQKLSADLVKSSECLRSWGLGEGDDLGVIDLPFDVLLLYADKLSLGRANLI